MILRMRNPRAGGDSFQEALTPELKILQEVNEPDQQSSEGPPRRKEQDVARYGEWGGRGKEGQLLPSVSMMQPLETHQKSTYIS